MFCHAPKDPIDHVRQVLTWHFYIMLGLHSNWLRVNLLQMVFTTWGTCSMGQLKGFFWYSQLYMRSGPSYQSQFTTIIAHSVWFINFSETAQIMLWLCFFAVKFPILPFQICLLEVHAEAGTSGPVISAGLLLKLGGYGILRFSLPLFQFPSTYFSPLTCCL